MRNLGIVLIAFGLGGCVATESELRYAVVRGEAVAMKRLPPSPGPGTSYPWQTRWLAPGDILYYTCGFARITYLDADVSTPLHSRERSEFKPRNYMVMTEGEWCRVDRSLLGDPPWGHHLIAYKTYRGKRYVISTAQIFTDADGRDYIGNRDAIDYLGLTPLLSDLTQQRDATYEGEESNWTWDSHRNDGCYSKEQADDEFSIEQQKNLLVPVEDLFCFQKGVLLSGLDHVG
jgi:hypothetical protein